MAAKPFSIKDAIQLVQEKVLSKLPNKDADVMALLSHVMEINETGLLLNLENKLTSDQRKKLDDAIKRLLKDEPLEYVTGISDFFGFKLKVSRDVLIPRIETEHLVELALDEIYSRCLDENRAGKLKVIDVGTGSGNIIIAIAKTVREPVDYFATEISETAAEIARENIEVHDLTGKITLHIGSLLGPFAEKVLFDVIVANLPYIPQEDMIDLPPSVKAYEPEVALTGGPGGNLLIKDLLTQSTEHLAPGGVILLELQSRLITEVIEYAKRAFPTAKIRIEKDQFGKERFLVISSKY